MSKAWSKASNSVINCKKCPDSDQNTKVFAVFKPKSRHFFYLQCFVVTLFISGVISHVFLQRKVSSTLGRASSSVFFGEQPTRYKTIFLAFLMCLQDAPRTKIELEHNYFNNKSGRQCFLLFWISWRKLPSVRLKSEYFYNITKPIFLSWQTLE